MNHPATPTAKTHRRSKGTAIAFVIVSWRFAVKLMGEKIVDASQDENEGDGEGASEAESSCQSGGEKYDSTGASGDQSAGLEGVRVVDSKRILAGHREVWIRHGEEMYRLRLTSSGRLYLSK